MTNSQSKPSADSDNYRIPKKNQPPLPLVPVDRISEETVTYKLRSNPADANSSKYSFTMAILQGTEDSRAGIRFVNDIRRVFTGLGMGRNDGQDIIDRRELVSRMLRGTCLAAFNQAFDASLAAFRAVPVAPRAAGETEVQFNGPEFCLLSPSPCEQRYTPQRRLRPHS